MAEAKVPYDRLEDSGDGAVFGSRIQVSSSNNDSISEAIDKLETGVSDTVFRTRRDFTGVPSSGDEQYILFGRGALPGTGFRWNENTDKVEFSNDGLVWVDITSIGGSSTKVEPVEITAPILANKYFDLDLLPSSGSNVRVFLVGGSVQYPTDDYELILDGGSLLKRVSWNGKGLESVLTLGDKVLFVYETTEEISGISSGPIKLKVDALSITATEIGNEWVDLSEIPLDYDQVALFVAGGTIQIYTTDYTIGIDGLGDLRRIDLSTLIANNDIVDGDTLIALYNIGSSAGGAIRSEHIEVETSTFTNNLNGLVAPATLQEALEEIDQFAFAGGIVTQTITNGVTATAPSEDAVFDALSGKANTSHTHAATAVTVDNSGFVGPLTGLSPSEVQQAFTELDSYFSNAVDVKPLPQSNELSPPSGFNYSAVTRYSTIFSINSSVKNFIYLGSDQSENNGTPYSFSLMGLDNTALIISNRSGNSVASKSHAVNFGFAYSLPVGDTSFLAQTFSQTYTIAKHLQTIIPGDCFGLLSAVGRNPFYSSGSLVYNTVVSANLALTSSSNKVLVVAVFSNEAGAALINDYTLAIDGSTQDEFTYDLSNAAISPMALAWLFTPGDTASHAYQLQAKTNTLTLSLLDATIFVLEVPSTVSSVQSSNFTGSGQKRNTMSVAANSRVLMLATIGHNTTPNSNTSYVTCKFQVDDTDVTGVYNYGTSTNGSGSLTDAFSIHHYITGKLTAGSHNFDAELTESGTGTVTQGRLITIEIPEN